jgi:hypothetical protein
MPIKRGSELASRNATYQKRFWVCNVLVGLALFNQPPSMAGLLGGQFRLPPEFYAPVLRRQPSLHRRVLGLDHRVLENCATGRERAYRRMSLADSQGPCRASRSSRSWAALTANIGSHRRHQLSSNELGLVPRSLLTAPISEWPVIQAQLASRSDGNSLSQCTRKSWRPNLEPGARVISAASGSAAA